MLILAANPECQKCRETPGFLMDVSGNGRSIRIKTLHGDEVAPMRIMCSCVRAMNVDVTNSVHTVAESIVHKPERVS